MTDLFAWADGARLRDDGIALAGEAQERDAPGWGERCHQALVALARRQRTVHVDDLLAAFPERPAHYNAYASVWVRAIREKVLTRTGEYRKTQDKAKRCHVYPIYRSEIWGLP